MLGAMANQLLQFLLDPGQGLDIDPVDLRAVACCLVIPLCTSPPLATGLGLTYPPF